MFDNFGFASDSVFMYKIPLRLARRPSQGPRPVFAVLSNFFLLSLFISLPGVQWNVVLATLRCLFLLMGGSCPLAEDGMGVFQH